jgi:hypothetical protein
MNLCRLRRFKEAMVATVKGAGDTGMRENPPVHSKGMKWHGKPHSPGKVSSIGGTAPISGQGKSGPGVPREVPYKRLEGRSVKVPVPGGMPRVSKADSGALDRSSYTGGKYPGAK